MVATSIWLYPILIVLVLWFTFLSTIFWKLLRTPKPETGPYEILRSQLTVAGMGFAAGAVGARILSQLLVFPSVLGFLFSSLGSGRIRFLGVGTSLVTGFLWFSLAMGL